MLFRKFKNNSQAGQTLVETVVGLMILAVGISTALALATSVYIQTTDSSQKLIAVGLAREGVEAVFNMRARHWLSSGVYQPCFNFETSDYDAVCRNDWLTGGYFDDASLQVGPVSSILSYEIDPGLWTLQTDPPTYRLNIETDMSSKGHLYVHDVGVPSNFYREIILEAITDYPYNADFTDIGPKIKVTSRVWWIGRGCPASDAYPASGRCRVELSTFMTNWRNF